MFKAFLAIGAPFLLIALFISSSCSISIYENTPPVEYGHTNRIAIIGDSISYGLNPESGSPYGWVHILSNRRASIWADTLGIIGNFAVSGDTAALWNSSIKIQPVIDFHPDIVIVLIGANDMLSNIYYNGVMSDSNKLTLSNNFIGILDKVTNGLGPVRLVVIDYYDLFDGYSPILMNYATSNYPYYLLTTLSNISQYTLDCDSMFASIAGSRGAVFVDIYTNFMNHCYGQSVGGSGHLSPDYIHLPLYNFDIHPVTAGHQKISDRVFPALQGITITN